MAIVILFFIAIAVVFTLYRKGILRKGSPSRSENCDKVSVNSFSAVPKSCRISFRLFDVRSEYVTADEGVSLDVKSDKVQQYIDEMVAMFSRRGEIYTVEFISFNFSVGVIFKHWFNEDDDV